jgi:hypothetical protein
MKAAGRLRLMDRYLTTWILTAIVVGVVLGWIVPGVVEYHPRDISKRLTRIGDISGILLLTCYDQGQPSMLYDITDL